VRLGFVRGRRGRPQEQRWELSEGGGEATCAPWRLAGAGDDEIATVLWGAESSITADELLGTEGAGPKEPSKRDRMIDYCRDRLAQAGEHGLEPTCGSPFYVP